jgi:hypothetical protein
MSALESGASVAPKVDGLVLQRVDAAAATDGLVVDLGAL